MRRNKRRAGRSKGRLVCCLLTVWMVVFLTSGCGRFWWESAGSNADFRGNRQTTEQEEIADQENTTEQENTGNQGDTAERVELEEKTGQTEKGTSTGTDGADQGQDQDGAEQGAEIMKEPLPRFYDARRDGRTSIVKDQGERGTCWAFASMQALESSLLPEESYDFSEDHMVHDPDFILNSEEGGDYVMAMAYLLSWRGPVLESQDPYGDGISPEGLSPVKHVQEIRLLPESDREAIKRAVYTTGGVQSSLYTALQKTGTDTAYYNQETQAYCYQGEEAPNHDVVIVGWDDDFPAENFTTKVPGNGAYLCENSWGTQFGEAGYFYVSYYDRNLGKTNLVYSRTEDPDNYSRIYQSDLCGWLGQIGYGEETVWATNVYRSGESTEKLCAVGFYATDRDTEYEVYVIPKVPENQESVIAKLSAGGVKKAKLSRAKGRLEDAGYYTISLDQPVSIQPKTRFAVMVRLKTPGAVHPVAVEYDTGDGRFRVDLSDGEGYVSPDGSQWERTEEAQNCNLCLKAYTRIEKKNG